MPAGFTANSGPWTTTRLSALHMQNSSRAMSEVRIRPDAPPIHLARQGRTIASRITREMDSETGPIVPTQGTTKEAKKRRTGQGNVFLLDRSARMAFRRGGTA